MADYRVQFRQLLESTYVSSRDSEESIVKKMTAFFDAVIPFIPEKLYRFRKMDKEGYAVNALQNGTITLCKASLFPDKYDSQVYIDSHKIKNELVKNLRGALPFVLKDIGNKNPAIKSEKASKVCYYKECGLDDQQIIERLIGEEFSEYITDLESRLKQRELRFRDSDRTARIACFTESIHSKFMWDAYAGGYSGFALEYNLRELFSLSLDRLKQVYVFPVIYSETKPDLTDWEFNNFILEQSMVQDEMKSLRPFIANVSFNLIAPFIPFLYKDRREYEHEQEWRMLYYDLDLDSDFVSVPDHQCLTGIYYGPSTKEKDIALLHSIAEKRGLSEHRVVSDAESRKYDLKVIDYKGFTDIG